MQELSQDDLKSILSAHSKVFVMYGAGWCGNCRMIKPRVKRKAEETDEVTFIYADAEKFPGSREFADVSNLPTYATFKDGIKIEQKMGNKWDNIETLIDELAAL